MINKTKSKIGFCKHAGGPKRTSKVQEFSEDVVLIHKANQSNNKGEVEESKNKELTIG